MRRTENSGALKANALEVAQFVSSFASETRILILCELLSAREMAVGELVAAVGLSQSALSQQLGRLRSGGIVESRRDAQNIYYRLSFDARTLHMLALLQNHFGR